MLLMLVKSIKARFLANFKGIPGVSSLSLDLELHQGTPYNRFRSQSLSMTLGPNRDILSSCLAASKNEFM
jgi:hypothetical protein